MNYEEAYVRLHHMATMLKHGQIDALQLDQEHERNQYADAIFSVLPILEKNGVIVEK